MSGEPQSFAECRRHVMKQAISTAVAVIALLGSMATAWQGTDEKLHITAWAVNMSNIGTGSNATVDFTVERWSTPEEREKLITTMVEQGQDSVLRVMQEMPPTGRMRFPSWQGPDPFNAVLGWDLRYAARMPIAGGGSRIVLALDRYMSIWELRNRPRTVDYPFTFIEIRVNKNGEGQGKMSVATKVNFDRQKKVIELENYASEAVRLQNVRVKSST
jgi:hypothetical protein